MLRAAPGLTVDYLALVERTGLVFAGYRALDPATRGILHRWIDEMVRGMRLFVLRQAGEPSGKNRIYRLYREEGLTVRKRRARRRAVGTRAPILVEAR